MIIRVMVVDPRPRPGSDDDVVVYQVPEKSRAHELLVEMLESNHIEYCTMERREKT